jgi:hypothetical protein
MVSNSSQLEAITHMCPVPARQFAIHFIAIERTAGRAAYGVRAHRGRQGFYSGPWLDGIVPRSGVKPQIEF